MITNKEHGLGWIPNLPDVRDYSSESEEVKSIFSNTTVKFNPVSGDLRTWCSPIENQGQLGSCTANAGEGLLEYYQRRACSVHLDAPRLFLCKVICNLLRWSGDTGAY